MTTVVDAPTRVDGVQLIGEMVGSGYRTPPALVRRRDGQVLQLTPLLYLVLQATDGRRTGAEIAELVGRALGRGMTEADVATLLDGHLRPLGLVRQADGTEPELKRSDPLLGLKLRVQATDPRTTRRLTDPFRVLFRPLIALVVLVAFVAVVAWVFFDRGLGASALEAFERPELLLLVFVMTVLSGGLHEFGHAAATRYGGGDPGVMGAGVYLVWPAFYTDVTDSYRLDRVGRIRTDLGGLYFNAIVVVLTFAWWWFSGWEALLLLVATQVLQMVQQLLPLLRFDGYHLLADLSGVPDLYQRIRPTLLGLLPHRWGSPENQVLKPWARALVTGWVLVTVPMMAFMLWALVSALPRLVGTAGSVLGEDAASVERAWADGEVVDVLGHVLQMCGVVLPICAAALILGRIAWRFVGGLRRWSTGSVLRRIGATVLSVVLVAGLSWAWWPDDGTYRPIQEGERGRLTSVLSLKQAGFEINDGPRAGSAARSRLGSGQPLTSAFRKDRPLPTKEDPALAMVLVPVDKATGEPSPEASTSPGTVGDGTWVFPFDQPLPPAEGDNQSLAVATEDGSIVYDLAFALVWADGNEVLNVNEAHAYASCSDCVAVAVAFQVVLIVDDAQVVVPQNLAVAANYDCHDCITAAIANQLVLSVTEQPGEEQLKALGAVWNRLIEMAQNISSMTLDEVVAELERVKGEIISILGVAPTLPAVPEPTSTPTPTTSSPTPAPSGTATQGPGASPSASSTASPSPSRTVADPTTSPPAPRPTATASTSGGGEPSATTDSGGSTQSPTVTPTTTGPAPTPEG